MRVERVIAMMMSGDSIVGYVKAERLDTRVELHLDMRDIDAVESVAIVRAGNSIELISLRDMVAGYHMKVGKDSISDLAIVVLEVPSGRVIAEGSRTSKLNREEYMPAFIEYISQNSDTYIGVKSHLHDALVDSDDIVDEEKTTVVEQNETIINETVTEQTDTHQEMRAETQDSILLDGGLDGDYSEGTPFYETISPQLEELFSRYEREEALEQAIDSSRFARIYYDEDRYYVVGEVRNEDGNVELICYGYPGDMGDTPPDEVKGSYEWVPLRRGNVTSSGYFMMYQNAVTGEIIEN